MIAAQLPQLDGAHWPRDAWERTRAEERILQFGTGVLLRALSAAAVDSANRAGREAGRIVVVQSTPAGCARTMNAQDGLFTLVERGLERGAPVDRTTLVGSIARAVVADTEWERVRAVVRRPELQVIISNVTEAGFRIDGEFPARLTDLLLTRCSALPDGPPLFVVPTELIPDNGPRLAEMVAHQAARLGGSRSFSDWLAHRVRFCSSLVDRITTGAPDADARAALEARLGYTDALLTVTEPHALWAIEGDPEALRAAFPIDAPPHVVFAPDLTFYRDRKLYILNGAHTATAPLAILAGVDTVREATEHPRLGSFMRRILFDEIVRGAGLPARTADDFARAVWERFQNPWLEHRWRTILANQSDKWRVRVAPTIAGFVARVGRMPEGLALACAASIKVTEDTGASEPPPAVARWWRLLDDAGVDAALDTLARMPA